MNIIINIMRILTAVIAPIAALNMAVLTLIHMNRDEDGSHHKRQQCLHCGKTRKGAEGSFHYTGSVGSARGRAALKQLTSANTPILGSESHFVCNHCARRYIRNEILQLILMVLLYPLYLYVIIPLLANNGGFANFLIETLLVVLSITGTTSAYDLYRAVRSGETSLSEARDRVAIHQRKNALGKKFSYYTRMGSTQFKK